VQSQLENQKQLSNELLDNLFDRLLKPLHSRNARRIFEVFNQYKEYKYITTHDIEIELGKQGFSINKKEINGWLLSLQEAELIFKLNERGKPVISNYEDRYTFDLYQLTKTGLIVSQKLLLFTKTNDLILPHLTELTPSKIHEIEDLYMTSKLLITLFKHGGSLSYADLLKELAIDREKLAVYSWPDASYSEKPLFKVTVKPQSLRAKVFKIFGWILEQDLSFKLTEEGLKIASDISSKE
jgi:hypothetical protein